MNPSPDPATPAPVFTLDLVVPPEAIDANGHVNNVAFVQWMQDAATRHFETSGGLPAMRAARATWVVRSHQIEYLHPAFLGDRLCVKTWVADFRRVRSTRRYEFYRLPDHRLLAKGETNWVFVGLEDGRPRSIPPEIPRALLQPPFTP